MTFKRPALKLLRALKLNSMILESSSCLDGRLVLLVWLKLWGSVIWAAYYYDCRQVLVIYIGTIPCLFIQGDPS